MKPVNVSDTSVSKASISINFYIVGLGGVVMFFIGIVTNTLNLLLLTRKSMKSTTNKYLSALAVSDTLVLIFSTVITSNSFISDYDVASFESNAINNVIDLLHIATVSPKSDTDPTNSSELATLLSTAEQPQSQPHAANAFIRNLYFRWVFRVYPVMYPFVYPLAIMFQVSTVWLHLAMSIDRFIAIHFPLRSLNFCTIHNAKKMIAVVFALAAVYSLPRLLEYKTQRHSLELVKSPFDNASFQTIETITLEITQVYFWMYLLFQSVLPLILLTLLNFALIASLHKSHQFQAQMTSKHPVRGQLKAGAHPRDQKRSSRLISRERNRREITIMLITLLVTFIALHVPSFLCNLFHGFHQKSQYTISISQTILCSSGNFLVMTNSATNFFAYVLFNKSFRRELLLYRIGPSPCRSRSQLQRPRHSSLAADTSNNPRSRFSCNCSLKHSQRPEPPRTANANNENSAVAAELSVSRV